MHWGQFMQDPIYLNPGSFEANAYNADALEAPVASSQWAQS